METIESVRLRSAVGLISLRNVKGVGPVAVGKLLDAYETIGDVIESSPEELKRHVNEKQRSSLQDNPEILGRAVDDALRQMDMADDHGYRMLSIYDASYAARLREIPNAPPVIFAAGPLEKIEAVVGFVGSDSPSEWGEYASYKMSEAFAEKGWGIVSGIADGCQSAAHSAAIAQKTMAVAVVAEGIDRLSSRRRDYVNGILDVGGVVVTEQLFGNYADQSSMIRRNRLISGLSLATFFIQGKLSPGLNDDDSIHAVKYAIQQGRPVFVPAIPSRELDDTRNEAALNLARLSPEDLSLLWEARDDLKDALLSMTAPSVAQQVAGRRDYPAVLEMLEGLLMEEFKEPQLALSA